MQVKMTQRLNQGLIAAEDAVIAIKALPVAAAEEPRKEAVVKLLRQTVLDVGGTATQMRMALERGAVVADKVFSPTAGYEGLSAEQVKILKELDKEKEKEEQQRKTQAQTQAQEPQMYGGRGGYVHRPYHRCMAAGVVMCTDRTTGAKGTTGRISTRTNSLRPAGVDTVSRCLSRWAKGDNSNSLSSLSTRHSR